MPADKHGAGPASGKITKVTKGKDATLVEITIGDGKPLIWRVPNSMFDRLGYKVGSDVSATVDSLGNLQAVRPALQSSSPRPFKI